ncbi:MAG: hypothetical protein JWR49_3892 [Tardiphaga sp.]|nr:hypothetical protein [Tardiphaga sp.]
MDFLGKHDSDVLMEKPQTVQRHRSKLIKADVVQSIHSMVHPRLLQQPSHTVALHFEIKKI